MFDARGYSDVSRADIACAAGMPKTTLNEMFGAEEDVFIATLEDVDAMLARLRTWLSPVAAP